MALPAPLNYAKNLLPNNLGIPNPPGGAPPSAASLWEIRKYSEAAAFLLNTLVVTDATIARVPSQRMLEVVAWMSMTVFRNALDRYPPATQALPAGPWFHANNAALLLAAAVTAAANLHQPAALPVNVGPNVAVESALELLYESVLEGIAAPTFALGWAALTPIQLPALPPPPVGGPTRGLPEAGCLCFGNAGAVPRLVVSCSYPKWDRFQVMQVWGTNARALYMPGPYQGSVTTLCDRLANRGGFNGPVPAAQDLQLAWNNNVVAGTQDAALAATWTVICNTAPAMPALRTYTRNAPGFQALPFNTNNMAPKARCRRCRVVFLFTMSALEPQLYNSGPPAERLGCAEVTAYQKCLRYGI